MKKDQRINIVTDEVTKLLLEGRAAGKKMSLSELLVEGGLLYGDFDPGFIEEIKKVAAQMDVRASLLLQNLVINQIATSKAYLEVFGNPSKILDWIFQFRGGKMMTGDDLLKDLMTRHTQIFKRWAENLIKISGTGEPFRFTGEEVEALAAAMQEKKNEEAH
jgi:hypothetical protein